MDIRGHKTAIPSLILKVRIRAYYFNTGIGQVLGTGRYPKQRLKALVWFSSGQRKNS